MIHAARHDEKDGHQISDLYTKITRRYQTFLTDSRIFQIPFSKLMKNMETMPPKEDGSH